MISARCSKRVRAEARIVETEAIVCPALFLLGDWEATELQRQTAQLHDSLARRGHDVTTRHFSAQDGADAHCQVNNLRLAHLVSSTGWTGFSTPPLPPRLSIPEFCADGSNWADGGVVRGLAQELRTIRVLGGATVSQKLSPRGMSWVDGEAEDLGVEVEGCSLVVDVDAGEADLHQVSSRCSGSRHRQAMTARGSGLK